MRTQLPFAVTEEGEDAQAAPLGADSRKGPENKKWICTGEVTVSSGEETGRVEEQLHKYKRRVLLGFPSGSAVKNPPAMQEMRVQSLGWEDPLDEGMANPLHYSCPENPRRTWRAMVHRVIKSWTRLKELSTHATRGLMKPPTYNSSVGSRGNNLDS